MFVFTPAGEEVCFVCYYNKVSEHVDKAHCRLRRSQVVLMPLVEACSAVGTRVFVVLHIQITHTQRGFQIPVATQQPLIAEADASSCHPALETIVCQFRKDTARQVHPGSSQLATQQVYTYKTFVKWFAEPVTILRLYQPVLPLLVIAQFEGIDTSKQRYSTLGGYSCLYPAINGSSSPPQKVCLDRNLGS